MSLNSPKCLRCGAPLFGVPAHGAHHQPQICDDCDEPTPYEIEWSRDRSLERQLEEPA